MSEKDESFVTQKACRVATGRVLVIHMKLHRSGDVAATKTFYDLQRAYGVPIWRSALRATAVTIKWYGWAIPA